MGRCGEGLWRESGLGLLADSAPKALQNAVPEI
jgi:hypothetical protein